LNYAFRLILPIGLFGVSIATAALPEIARRATENDRIGMQRTISSALRMMLMLNVPATVGLIALAHLIVALLLQRGHFRPRHRRNGRGAALLCTGPAGILRRKIASPSFYSLGDSRTPVTVSVIAVLTNLTINLLLVRVMGYRGLALGTALAAMFNAGMLLWLLRRRLGGLEERRVLIAFVKISAASGAMGIAAFLTSSWLASPMPLTNSLSRAIQLGTAIGVGVVVLVAAARLLRLAEFDEAFDRVLRRVRSAG
jgi:putative peptidoglycan lipid II flippase